MINIIMPAKKKPFVTFEEAKKIVQSENIGSESQFYEWHKSNKPKVIPARPNRTYEKEWKGWNNFLNLKNKFSPERPHERVRPYSEALLWVHGLKIPNKAQWDKWCSENKAARPTDIPMRPDLAYRKHWVSWNHWLGNTSHSKLEAQKVAQHEAAIFYIIRDRVHTQNILTFGVEVGGVSALKERWERLQNFDVVKLYKYRQDAAESIQQILNYRSAPMSGSDNTRIVNNVPQLLWDLSTILDII
jgi:hypothetical protein